MASLAARELRKGSERHDQPCKCWARPGSPASASSCTETKEVPGTGPPVFGPAAENKLVVGEDQKNGTRFQHPLRGWLSPGLRLGWI